MRRCRRRPDNSLSRMIPALNQRGSSFSGIGVPSTGATLHELDERGGRHQTASFRHTRKPQRAGLHEPLGEQVVEGGSAQTGIRLSLWHGHPGRHWNGGILIILVYLFGCHCFNLVCLTLKTPCLVHIPDSATGFLSLFYTTR